MPGSPPGAFLDTNVLLYVAGADEQKADRAEALIRDGGVISIQVLNELANVARRKMKLSWDETHRLLATFRGLLDVNAVSIEVHDKGLAIAERHQLSIYDAMIVAAALEAGCATLWSEDMQDGLLIEGRLTIRNPFRA